MGLIGNDAECAEVINLSGVGVCEERYDCKCQEAFNSTYTCTR